MYITVTVVSVLYIIVGLVYKRVFMLIIHCFTNMKKDIAYVIK